MNKTLTSLISASVLLTFSSLSDAQVIIGGSVGKTFSQRLETQELQKIEDVIKAQGDAQRINMEKGAWVYKVNKSVYEKLAKDSKFFL